MKDQLDLLIEQKSAEAEELRNRLGALMVEIKALELAASLRPVPSGRRETRNGFGGEPLRKGRQPGAISKQWRDILVNISINFPFGSTENQIWEVAKSVEKLENIRPRDVRTRLDSFKIHGYVEQRSGGLWHVTELAAKKFNQDRDNGIEIDETDLSPEEEIVGNSNDAEPAPISANSAAGSTTHSPVSKSDIFARKMLENTGLENVLNTPQKIVSAPWYKG